MREINIGERFGRLQVIGLGDKVHEANGSWSCRYLCHCDCGTVKQIRARALLQPKNPTRSCGCLRLSRIHEQKTLHGESGGRFVGKRTQLYRCWSNIKSRCYNHNVRSYQITVQKVSLCVMNGCMIFSHLLHGQKHTDLRKV